jgi:hypothetical protein
LPLLRASCDNSIYLAQGDDQQMTNGDCRRLAAAGVLVASLAVSACSTDSNGGFTLPHHRQQGQSTTARARAVLEATAARAESAIRLTGETDGTWGILSNPVSSLGPGINTDELGAVGPGHYVLAFACVGTGQVAAVLTVGKVSARTRVTCQQQPEPVRLRLSVHRGGTEYVQFTAIHRETVAIACKLAGSDL